jgi:hypothetical protein
MREEEAILYPEEAIPFFKAPPPQQNIGTPV